MNNNNKLFASTSELDAKRYQAQEKCHEMNMTFRGKEEIAKKLFRNLGSNFEIWGSFFCELGQNISIGNNVFINVNCVMLDSFEITLGDNTSIGPNVGIYTTNHSLDAEERKDHIEYGGPVVIGNDVWIGGNVTILPGVEIGDLSVIGAGSVIHRNIPENAIVRGTACRIPEPFVLLK